VTRTYVVTGAASGVGEATCALLRGMGLTVITVDLHQADVCADLGSVGGRLEAAEQVIELSGGTIDAVITCAGVSAPKPYTVSVNFFGATQFIEALRECLSESDAPRVAVISATASLWEHDDILVNALLRGVETEAIARARTLANESALRGSLNYSSSKYALSEWVKHESIKPEWAGAGIALNAIAPGTVVTPLTEHELSSAEGRHAIDQAVPMPLNYHLHPTAVAHLLTWLTSVENTHVTGQTIFIDGGAEASIHVARERAAMNVLRPA